MTGWSYFLFFLRLNLKLKFRLLCLALLLGLKLASPPPPPRTAGVALSLDPSGSRPLSEALDLEPSPDLHFPHFHTLIGCFSRSEVHLPSFVNSIKGDKTETKCHNPSCFPQRRSPVLIAFAVIFTCEHQSYILFIS